MNYISKLSPWVVLVLCGLALIVLTYSLVTDKELVCKFDKIYACSWNAKTAALKTKKDFIGVFTSVDRKTGKVCMSSEKIELSVYSDERVEGVSGGMEENEQKGWAQYGYKRKGHIAMGYKGLNESDGIGTYFIKRDLDGDGKEFYIGFWEGTVRDRQEDVRCPYVLSEYPENVAFERFKTHLMRSCYKYNPLDIDKGVTVNPDQDPKKC